MDVFSSFVKQIYSVTKKMCETYAYDYKKIDITSMWINLCNHTQLTHHTHILIIYFLVFGILVKILTHLRYNFLTLGHNQIN